MSGGAVVERVARAIWESQRSRLSDQDGINARLAWNSDLVPQVFWDSYRRDARAALAEFRVIVGEGLE